MKITKRETEIWTGSHKGVTFEINKFKSYTGGDNWTHYIFIRLERIPDTVMAERFWLSGEVDSKGRVNYKTWESIINHLEFHGGCTWYSKEQGFDGGNKAVKIGCDYQHYWDEGREYDLQDIMFEVEKTIDSFLDIVPDYKYWCCGNGNLYSLSEGTLVDETFKSFEYFDKERCCAPGEDT